MKKIIAFDCDSTLSAIEGVDELARIAGDQIFQEVENLTNLAMDGEVPCRRSFR
jgi:phosphoserine phosphatase